ncbi:MAG: NADH-quinone oxidoreductase subunit D [Planctomycetes bacterium]|nr:NADH-quinone oxidoreductase subunit D [Planctomycetota bacterium]
MFDTEELVINMGPQHPSTHGVLRLVLKTDGEIVSEVVPYVGYLHRALEKIAERVTYIQFMPFTDRLDYLAAMNCNFAYAGAVEKLAGIEVPPRAQGLRVIFSELNRIASHLVFFGTCGLDLGAWTPLLYAFREREMVLELFEMTCGARLTYNYGRIGGVSFDIPPEFEKETLEFCDYFVPRIKEYNELLTGNRVFVHRTANVGVISQEQAKRYSLVGPNLRGSGIKFDLRKDEPYWGYEKYDFNVPVGAGEYGVVGDAWNRYWVRILEMTESVKIIRQALAQLPSGDIIAKVPKVFKPPVGEAYFRAESPRGETGFYIVSDGTQKPSRLRIRTGSFTGVSIIPEVGKGAMISDLVAIVGSMDIILPEIDR